MEPSERTIYLLRHLGARPPHFIHGMRQVVGAPEGVMGSVGFGESPDGESHLIAKDAMVAYNIGKSLALPRHISSLYLAASPLPRAEETNRYVFEGLSERHAIEVLELVKENGDPDFFGAENQTLLATHGLLARTTYGVMHGLDETKYKDSQGRPDRGVELINQTNTAQTKDEQFPKYRKLVQAGFRGDIRSEHPRDVAMRGLVDLVRAATDFDVTIANSHQPNVEIITAALGGTIGADANELWDLAGGDVGLGGGICLKLVYDSSKNQFVDGSLSRTEGTKNPIEDPAFSKEMPLSLDYLNWYLGN